MDKKKPINLNNQTLLKTYDSCPNHLDRSIEDTLENKLLANLMYKLWTLDNFSNALRYIITKELVRFLMNLVYPKILVPPIRWIVVD